MIPIPFFPIRISTEGNKDLEAEEAVSIELGYRGNLHETFSLDVAGFYTEFEELSGIGFGGVFVDDDPRPHLVIVTRFVNAISWETWGGEVSATWRPVDELRVVATDGLFEANIDFGGTIPPTADGAFDLPGMNPEQQVGLRTWLDLPDDLVPVVVEDYVRGDVRIGWHPLENLGDQRRGPEPLRGRAPGVHQHPGDDPDPGAPDLLRQGRPDLLRSTAGSPPPAAGGANGGGAPRAPRAPP